MEWVFCHPDSTLPCTRCILFSSPLPVHVCSSSNHCSFSVYCDILKSPLLFFLFYFYITPCPLLHLTRIFFLVITRRSKALDLDIWDLGLRSM
ncbi:hypothetical protein BDV30DRAFT_104237 [Aspergillus minisclerotigenes]|uniref:Uncharacterized protein n=1 Tax=Aspergillus minisclerotigenes TaxID=656917 RepID=A0A5N6JJB6_9EURO|nr:hypothetical protein BDV30DRAFT_104237 [Aspergillus minisclerotigenes]